MFVVLPCSKFQWNCSGTGTGRHITQDKEYFKVSREKFYLLAVALSSKADWRSALLTCTSRSTGSTHEHERSITRQRRQGAQTHAHEASEKDSLAKPQLREQRQISHVHVVLLLCPRSAGDVSILCLCLGRCRCSSSCSHWKWTLARRNRCSHHG